MTKPTEKLTKAELIQRLEFCQDNELDLAGEAASLKNTNRELTNQIESLQRKKSDLVKQIDKIRHSAQAALAMSGGEGDSRIYAHDGSPIREVNDPSLNMLRYIVGLARGSTDVPF